MSESSSHLQPYVLLHPAAQSPQPLSDEQLEVYRNAQVHSGVPVRFLHAGRAVDIVSGQTQDPKTPEHCQIRYWNFDRETAQQIAQATGTQPRFDD